MSVTSSSSTDARDRVRLAPGIEGLGAIGASSLDDLLEPERLLTWARAERIASRHGDVVLRLPLPGTPDANGRVHEAPRGAGTGNVVLRVYRTTLGRGMQARLSEPRSASLAERDWNLACRLRERGVATPDLVLVGARGRGLFSRQSVLVTRELARMVPFDRWVHEDRSAEDRGLGLEAVARALARLARSGVVLPELETCDVFVHGGAGGCGVVAAIELSGAGASASPVRRLPGVVFANLRDGFFPSGNEGLRGAEPMLRLRADLEGLVRPRERSLLRAEVG